MEKKVKTLMMEKMEYKNQKDDWDILWFDYEYYGTSQEIEYTITYKYEVIDSLLHFQILKAKNLFFIHQTKFTQDNQLIQNNRTRRLPVFLI